MKRLLITSVALISAMAVFDPAIERAFADEDIARPRRAARPAAQPRQAAQPQRQASNWNGGQVGGSNGASSVNNTFVEPGAYICPEGFLFGVDCFENLFSFSGRKTVYTIGAFAGYRWQFGGVVAGFEGDIAWKNAETSAALAVRDCFEGSPPFCDVYRDDFKTGSVKQTWDASIRARLGWLVTPWTLLYATGGVAFGEIKGSFTYNGAIFDTSVSCCVPVGTATASGTWSDVRVGGTVGAGVETEVWTGIKARFEYRYTDFGTYTKNLPVHTDCSSCESPSSNVTIDLKNNFHTFRIGLGFDL